MRASALPLRFALALATLTAILGPTPAGARDVVLWPAEIEGQLILTAPEVPVGTDQGDNRQSMVHAVP